jgi:hypothetical protein
MYRSHRAPRSMNAHRRVRSRLPRPLALVVALLACGDSTGPAPRELTLLAGAGDGQFASPGQLAADSLAVIVTDATSGRAAANVTVRWRVVAGSGATVAPVSSTTSAQGVARTSLRMGAEPGEVRVEADADGRTGTVATFRVTAVATPVIDDITPEPVAAGGVVTITGSNFSPHAEDNAVLFGGRRGRVTEAGATRLVVEAPACLPGRDHEVRVRLGAVTSNAIALSVTGGTPTPLRLNRGEARILSDPAELSCLTLPGDPGARHLIVALNTARAQGLPAFYDLIGLDGSSAVATLPRAAARTDAALEWEAALRLREQALLQGGHDALLQSHTGDVALQTSVGDRRQFNVLNPQNRTDRVTAEVRAVSQRAIIYVDVQTPADGFNQADIDRFAQMFDDPIWPTDVAVFGNPTDVDGNGRIIILFTPAVNRLTKANESSFIAGFFYGCDLLESSRCSDTNRAEIFYSMVPDPRGEFGGQRTRDTVLRTVPGVLAHEFQHMINFGRKGRLDLLWLSEGLAHAAEEIVGRVFEQRGDPIADDFRRPNHLRARAYVGSTAITSLVSEESPGSLELRGGGWLLVRYLMEHYGEGILSQLTGSTALGAANIEQQTGIDWNTLFAEFAVALWATGAPELGSTPLAARLTFGSYDLRASVATPLYPLRPLSLPYRAAFVTGYLNPASQDYFDIAAPAAGGPDYTLSYAGRWGGTFAGTPRLAVLRVN